MQPSIYFLEIAVEATIVMAIAVLKDFQVLLDQKLSRLIALFSEIEESLKVVKLID